MTPQARTGHTKVEQEQGPEQGTPSQEPAPEQEAATEEPKELTEDEKVEQERLEYHQSIQDEIKAQQEEAGTVEEYPNAEERAVKTAPAPGQVPGDHIPVG